MPGTWSSDNCTFAAEDLAAVVVVVVVVVVVLSSSSSSSSSSRLAAMHSKQKQVQWDFESLACESVGGVVRYSVRSAGSWV